MMAYTLTVVDIEGIAITNAYTPPRPMCQSVRVTARDLLGNEFSYSTAAKDAPAINDIIDMEMNFRLSDK